MVSVLIAHTFGDILNTGIRLGEKQLFGFFHTQTDQIIDRCVSYFVFEQARDVERTQLHIARNLLSWSSITAQSPSMDLRISV